MARFTFERVVGGLLSYTVDTSSKSLYRAALVKEHACAWSSQSQAKRELMTDYGAPGLKPPPIPTAQRGGPVNRDITMIEGEGDLSGASNF
jgi:hypothetical protein